MAPRPCTPKRLSALALICISMASIVAVWAHLNSTSQPTEPKQQLTAQQEQKRHQQQQYVPPARGAEKIGPDDARLRPDDRGASPAPTAPRHRPHRTAQHTRAPLGRPPEGGRLHDAPLPARPVGGYVGVPDGEPLRLRCRECALVSSSGQMLGAAAGRAIDATECVWRMNNAPLAPRYRADVGARTAVRVVSHTSVPLLAAAAESFFSNGSDNTQGNATYVIWGPMKNMRRDPPARVYSKVAALKARFPSARIYTLTDQQMQRCDDIFTNETGKDRLKSGAYLSTGWFTLVLAMEVCDSIHVYGMIDDGYCSRPYPRAVPYHYYQPGGSGECREYSNQENARAGAHRFITEKTVFGRWAARGNIRFSHPEWPNSDLV